jgi:hypothetical protein
LFFALALAVAMPTTALAAPIIQGGNTAQGEAVVVAYYESDEVAIGDEESVVIGLSLYDDDTFEMAVDLLDGEDPSVAYGDYEENDDGVLLTLIGADNADFDEPTDMQLTWDADDSLIIPGTPDGLFGEEDVILYETDAPVDDSDTSGDTSDDTGDDTSDDTGSDVAVELGGVYISPVQPTDSSDGVVYLLNLLPDGSASLNSDYLNLEVPIFEVGTWTDNGDDTATVEITGTVDTTYDDPIVLDFTVGDSGELVLENVSLYPLSLLGTDMSGDDSSDVSGDIGDDTGTEDSSVYTYVAEATLAGEEDSTYIYMLLYDDGTVALTDQEGTGTLYGEWTYEDEVLSVSLTSDDESDLDEPLDLVFELSDDGSLVATDYPTDVFGEDGLTFYSADDSSEADGEFYFYESDTLPSEDSEGIVISLILSEDGAAMVSTDSMNGEDPYLEYGEWTRDDAGAVIITINEGPDGAYDEPYVFTFEEDPDDLSLNLTDESVEVFGDAGLVLNRIQ